MKLDDQLTTLADQQQIKQLIRMAWGAIDAKDWDTFANAFADDGVCVIMGQRRTGRDEIVAGPARDLSKYEVLQHIITNKVVRVIGDEADGRWYAIAVHVPRAAEPTRHADVGLRYRFRALRGADGWRFREVELEPLWSSGLAFSIEDAPGDG